MRKFKHKLTGDIVEQAGASYRLSTQLGIIFPFRMIENTLDWEEIIEKDYEILSFFANKIGGYSPNPSPNYIWLPHNNGSGKWSRGGYLTSSYTTEQIMNHPDYSIYSVKRLSDGEVFTIGDIIDGNTYCKQRSIIQSIKFSSNNPNGGLSILISGEFGYWLNSVKKSKQKLFTTEDEVDIFEGDRYSTVSIENWTQVNNTINPKATSSTGIIKYFSTKEKAKEYIIMNKPCLSYNDIMNNKIIDNNDLLKLVKEKLK